MKFLIEVLDEKTERSHYDHLGIHGESKIFVVVNDQQKNISLCSAQVAGLEDIPDHSMIRITRAD